MVHCALTESGSALQLSLIALTSGAQETRDGELAVLHDLQSVLQAARGHALNAAALHDLEAATPNLRCATVKVLRCVLLPAHASAFVGALLDGASAGLSGDRMNRVT